MKDYIKFVVLLLLLFMRNNFLVVSGKRIRCLERERKALLEFKKGIIDDYGLLSSWGSEDHKKECCNWKGVVCSNTTNHVISLQQNGFLENNILLELHCLGGEIGSSLLELQHLSTLDLSVNNFGGSAIPKFIGSMTMLRHLNLGFSNFSGIIPHELGNLTHLQWLDLSGNSLFILENPVWISRLSFLSYLDLSNVVINHTLSFQNILKSPSLKELSLSDCSLTDITVSPDFFVNSSVSLLSTLDLSFNHLTSSIFDWLFNISSNFDTLVLDFNKLEGPIPHTFGELNFLEYFALSGNMLEGGIPRSFGNLSHLQALSLGQNFFGESIEESLGNLCCKATVSLEILDLSNNQLTGPLPNMSSFLSLRFLKLSSNRITGSLPLSLGHLTKLEELDVSFNSMEGTISEANFIKLHNLKVLSLSSNEFEIKTSPTWNPPFQLQSIFLSFVKVGPHFPAWLRTQRNIWTLELAYAGISDEVPPRLWHLLAKTHTLNLSHNNIGGRIPNISLGSISIIDLSSNNFSGPIPLFHPTTSIFLISGNKFTGTISSVCSKYVYKFLVLLDISYNHLTGVLPNCWEGMYELLVLNLSNNYFLGEIPHSLGSLLSLKTLHMNDNFLSGELPSMKNSRFLELINLGGNNLTGNLSDWLGKNNTDVTYLILRQNSFFGNIPPEICNLTNIQLLDLSRNHISGEIPKCFNHFTSLVLKNRTFRNNIYIPFKAPVDGNVISNYIVLYYNDYALVQWKGQESEYKNSLGLLRLMDLSSNSLVGSIPQELSSLKGLISLNLSRNGLTGKIDPNIGQMDMLESLDLSRNHLSGVIPTGLAQLHFLQVLDLSNNNFSGKIPSGPQLQSFNESVYAENNELCGPSLAPCRGDGITPSLEKQGDKTDDKGKNGFMNLSFVQEFGISMAFGFIFGFWGIVGPLLLKESWRRAYFSFFGRIGDWVYVKTTIFVAKLRRN